MEEDRGLRETYTDKDGKKTTVQKGDQFSIRGFLNGRPCISRWRVDEIKGYDFVTSAITGLETDIISAEFMGGQSVDVVSRQVEELKLGAKVDFCADSVVDLLREEGERNKTSRKRNNSQASPIGIVHV